MNTYVFGGGPLPLQGTSAVTAPGSRTWQIARCVIESCQALNAAPPRIITLEDKDSENTRVVLNRPSGDLAFDHQTLSYESYLRVASSLTDPAGARAVIATGSAASYYAGALAARKLNAPLWVDVFGDPLCEIQSQAQVHEDEVASNEGRQVHVWRLLAESLVQGDRFSTLSGRQRHALYGQLGCAGRLNQHTAPHDMVSPIPFGYYTDELPVSPPRTQRDPDRFTVLWCGSFNTWMDVDTLVRGMHMAFEASPEVYLLIAGGGVPGYSLRTFEQFKDAMKPWESSKRIEYLDWLPADKLPEVYKQADVGLSIDRFTYEAVLGSRTRIAGFLAHGLPVVSTDLCEFTAHLVQAELIIPFEVGNPTSLCDAILSAKSQARSIPPETASGFLKEHYDAQKLTRPLADWLQIPAFAPDKHQTNPTNKLISFWNQRLSDLRG